MFDFLKVFGGGKKVKTTTSRNKTPRLSLIVSDRERQLENKLRALRQRHQELQVPAGVIDLQVKAEQADLDRQIKAVHDELNQLHRACA